MSSRVVHLRPPVPAHVARLFVAEVPPDDALVTRALSGDRAAEEVLYRRHGAMVLGLSTRLLMNEADGEDVMQETFGVAFDRLAGLREPSAFRGWVARIAVSLSRRRMRRRRLFTLFGAISDDLALADLTTGEASAEARAELSILSGELAKLPADERIAWCLRYVEGYSLEECAELLGCSLATAKRRIAAARQTVTAHFGCDDV